MEQLSATLKRLINDTRAETARSKATRPLDELKAQHKDAPAVIPFFSSVKREFCLIAEIKESSPSMGQMRRENVERAAEVYRRSPIVRAISVLTNRPSFGPGMTLARLRQIKLETGKPVIRKDFITDPYEVHEARFFGADAILLMANILNREQMKELYGVACELGMDVLFETHTPEEIEKVPANAKIYGINSRSFDSEGKRYAVSRWLGQWFGSRRDLTLDYSRFDYCKSLPGAALKIAESGVKPDRVQAIRDSGFDAMLVGTSLLIGPTPIDEVMTKFETALHNSTAPAPGAAPRAAATTADSRH